MRDVGWPMTGAVAAFIAGVLLASGCGARTLQTHVEVASESRDLIAEARDFIVSLCTRERLTQLMAEDGAKAATYRDRCRITVEVYNTLTPLWSAYVDAALAESFDAPTALQLLERAAQVYDQVRELIEALGGPSLPEMEL